jgi:hypothetical protein
MKLGPPILRKYTGVRGGLLLFEEGGYMIELVVFDVSAYDWPVW